MNKLTDTEQVTAFHEKYGHPIAERPHVPAAEVVQFRSGLIVEEFGEYLKAVYGPAPLLMAALELLKSEMKATHPRCDDLAEIADGLTDLKYVTIGTELVFGFPVDAMMAEVQRSNMQKVYNGPNNKPTKPIDWTPPDVVGVLKKAGMR